MLRTVTTENSIWKFDLDERLYCRTRRTVEPFPPLIQYTDDWEPYLDLVEPGVHPYGDNTLLVVRPVPFGTGQLRRTGPILSDVTEEEA